MERILVLSDTHGNTDKAIKIFDSIAGITAVIHLGDSVKDAMQIENYVYPVPVYYVPGNNDFFYYDKRVKTFEISNKTFVITHGHLYNLDSLKELSCEADADIVLFGHTHRPYYEKDGDVIFANPGSTTYPRGADASYGIAEIDKETGKLSYCNINL